MKTYSFIEEAVSAQTYAKAAQSRIDKLAAKYIAQGMNPETAKQAAGKKVLNHISNLLHKKDIAGIKAFDFSKIKYPEIANRNAEVVRPSFSKLYRIYD